MSLRWVCHPKLPKAFEIPKPHKKIFNSKPQIPSKTQFLEPDKKLIKKKQRLRNYIYIYTNTNNTVELHIYYYETKGSFFRIEIVENG